MNHAFVCIGGEGPSAGRIAALERSLVVAADSGLSLCFRLGLGADLVVGDMDSVDPEDLARVAPGRIIRHPEDKDLTDTELALDLAWDQGGGDCTILGGGGGRMDHVLAMFQFFLRPKRPVRWYTGNSEIIFMEQGGKVELPMGSTCSVFPLVHPARVRSRGLQWPLDDIVFTRGDFGISNRTVTAELSMEVLEGAFLFVRNFDHPGDRAIPWDALQ